MLDAKDLKTESNQRYHSSNKGCVISKIHGAKWSKKDVDNYYCHTHGVICTKTGWELGWYLGTNSLEIWDSESTN